ncbi:Reverse transcriptase-like [Sesbania bispinosa]|nr:Reverse transcriptase-like [Sesbania bispinosa]
MAPQPPQRVVVRDAKGVLVGVVANRVPVPSPLMAEALALREAIVLAHNLQWPRCLFESGNIQVVRASREEGKMQKLNMKGNEVANHVARSALRGPVPIDWVSHPHPPLRVLLEKDITTQRRPPEDRVH